jgi:uncharacterized repeat protein (TIGR04002 family)
LSKKTDEKIGVYAVSAVFAATIMVTTAFIKVPGPFGFMHIGDAVIFLAAVLLPTPLAVASSALGAAAADLIAGYPMYIIPTIIIKSLMALVFYRRNDKEKAFNIVSVKNIISAAVASVIGIAGYFSAELIMYGGGAIVSFPFNALQEAAGMAIFIIIGVAIDRSGLKKFLKIF